MSPSAEADLRALREDVARTFDISAAGRIERGPVRPSGPRQGTGPARVPPPRLVFCGCAAGNFTHLRHDIGDRIAARVLALVAAEPPWRDPEVPPGCLDEIGALLSRAAPAVVNGPEFVFRLPNGLGFPHGATLVKSDTPEGEALLERLARGGMPQALLDAGFLSLGDFWWPWCVATDGDDIAAMAFTPRLCEASAEIGVYTFPAFRGRGLAAAVTAGWSSLPALAGRSLVYSTHVPNRSSQRVAARLGLHQLGGRIRIA